MTDADRRNLQRSLRELREGALGMISGAEAELARVAGRVLDTVGLKGEGDAPARVREAVHELVDRARQRREELERRVDDGVKAAVARVRRPIAEDLAAVRSRLEKVQHRIDDLARRRRQPKR